MAKATLSPVVDLGNIENLDVSSITFSLRWNGAVGEFVLELAEAVVLECTISGSTLKVHNAGDIRVSGTSIPADLQTLVNTQLKTKILNAFMTQAGYTGTVA